MTKTCEEKMAEVKTKGFEIHLSFASTEKKIENIRGNIGFRRHRKTLDKWQANGFASYLVVLVVVTVTGNPTRRFEFRMSASDQTGEKAFFTIYCMMKKSRLI